MFYYYPITHMINYGDTIYSLAQYYRTTPEEILHMNPNINPYNLTVGDTLTIMQGYSANDYYPTTNKPVYENRMENTIIPDINLESNMVSSKDDITKKIDLQNKMQEVWLEHIYWTRLFLVSVASNLNDLNSTTDRLLQNPQDIANVFKDYYEDEVTNKISTLIKEHLIIGGDLIKASKRKDTASINELNKRWYSNADKMADAFSSINPNYDKEEVRKMLYKHLDLTKEEVANRLSANYADDIKSFDKVKQEILKMSTYFADGIIKQFPDKF